MRPEKLEYLQKKYESRLNPSKDMEMEAGMGSRPKGPGGRHGHRNVAGGKPKNVRKTVDRLFGYISQDKWIGESGKIFSTHEYDEEVLMFDNVIELIRHEIIGHEPNTVSLIRLKEKQ